jgi:hypothetical protein
MHTLETPLEPSSLYFWTVRARFELGGQVKVTDWGVSRVPHPSYYRFKTRKPAEP